MLAFWGLISFHFWSFGPSNSFHFGLMGLDCLSFWHFGLSFSFILAFWAFIVLSFWPPWTLASEAFSHKLPGPLLDVAFPFIIEPFANLDFLDHVGLLGLRFPFILVFWAFDFLSFCACLGLGISFHFGLLGAHLAFWAFHFLVHFGYSCSALHFLSLSGLFAAFWASFPFILGKNGLHFLIKFWQILSAPRPASFSNVHFLSFLAFWAFISFHFGLLDLYFLSF